MRQLTEVEKNEIFKHYLDEGRSIIATARKIGIPEKVVSAFVNARGIKRTQHEIVCKHPWRGRRAAAVSEAIAKAKEEGRILK